MLASIFIPTRKRPDELLKTLDSISNTTSNPDDVEVFVKFDDDDDVTKDFFQQNEIRVPYHAKLIIGPRPYKGWYGVYVDYNKMAEMSQGTFLIPFNDDADFVTNKWDDILREYVNRMCILHPKNPSPVSDVDMMFPIIHRNIAVITNCFALSTSIDRQYEMMVEEFPELRIREPRIEFIHPRDSVMAKPRYDPNDKEDIRNYAEQRTAIIEEKEVPIIVNYDPKGDVEQYRPLINDMAAKLKRLTLEKGLIL